MAMRALFRFLKARREHRERIARDAGNLLTFLGEGAYDEARGRARSCRERRDQAGFRFWSKVAVEIAKRTGHRVREKVADRYAAGPPSRAGDHRRTSVDREIVSGLVDIAQGIAHLAHGRDGVMAQSVCARVWQLVDLRRLPRENGHGLCGAIEALAAEL